MKLGTLVFRYTLFAVIATVANLGAQRVVLLFGETGMYFVLAMIAGTGVGLVTKYLLDKRWIFEDRTTGLAARGQQFTLYTVMGILTTAIFWGTETSFWLIWRTDTMRELGAIAGLTIGYVIKYNLDKRYVFAAAARRPGAVV